MECVHVTSSNSQIQNKRATKGFILIRHKKYQIYTCLQLSSSIAYLIWKPAHFELRSYGDAWPNTKIAFVEKYTVAYLVIFDHFMYRSIPKPPMPPPPRANPRAFDFFEKFWSNSPLCCQFRRSNAPPVRASKWVKSLTLQACEANCGNKFCKILSHYEFLVQLVFAPHFKERHVPR